MPGGATDNPHDVPATSGDYESSSFTAANEPERVVGIGTETESILIFADTGNSGTLYVGFDDDVSTSTGIPLVAGAGLSFDIDTNQLGLFIVADTIGDGYRYIFTS